jgi:hypothetical protein
MATAMATQFTNEEQAAMRQEVEDACESITIDKDNIQIYFKISTKGREVEWMPMPCKKCTKPTEESTLRNRIPKAKTTFYISAMKASETIKQETHWAIIEAGFTSKENKHEKEIDFPKWQEGTSWEQYRKEIGYYREATTRKPINQMMEMNRALKESNQVEIAKRLITKMEEFKNDDDIIEKCVQWITNTYGKTKYEEQGSIGERFKVIKRDLDKDIQVYIAQFDEIMKESEALGLNLPDNWKAIMLQIGAGLSKQEKNNVATLVNMDSKMGDCYMQMKMAIRKIGHREEKDSVKVMLAEDEYVEDPVESILYGERTERRSGNNYWKPRDRRDGGNQQRGYQRDQGDRRQFRNDFCNDRPRDGGYRNYQPKGLVQRIEELDPQS